MAARPEHNPIKYTATEQEDARQAKLVIASILLALFGLPILLFGAMLLAFSQDGGLSFGHPENNSSNITAAVIYLLVGANCTAQGVAVARTRSKLALRYAQWPLLGVFQLVAVGILIAYLGGHSLFTDLFGDNEGLIVRMIFDVSMVISAASSLTLWALLLYKPLESDDDWPT